MSIKTVMKKFVPPILLHWLKRPNQYGFFGDYATWKDACVNSSGYDSKIIFEKLKKSAATLKIGRAAFERDTVVFKKTEYNWFVLASLFWANAKNNKLDVLDYGGSFGNVYLQHKKFFENIKNISWRVVEQKHIAEFSKKEFSDDKLSFHHTIDEALLSGHTNTALLGSSLQYAEKPYDILKKLCRADINLIIIDRTPFFKENGVQDRITVQKVKPEIYSASYPAHIFNTDHLKEFMRNLSYSCISELHQGTMTLNGTQEIMLNGLLFERNEHN